MNKKLTRRVALSGVIAALYVLLTFISFALGLSSGVIQLRLSECLCVFAFFDPCAAVGLSVGCLVADMLTGCVPLDTLFGTLATLVGALLCFLLGKIYKKTGAKFLRFLAPLPNALANSIAIPLVLKLVYTQNGSVFYFAACVFASEILVSYALGIPLLLSVEKTSLPSG